MKLSRNISKPMGTTLLLALLVALWPATSSNSQGQSSSSSVAKTVTLDRAQKVIAAALKKAKEIDVAMNIAVLDAGGHLKAFVRMDEAFLGSIDISINKAYTARAFNTESKNLAAAAQPGGPLFGLHSTNGGRIVLFGGGIPLRNGSGKVVGSIGVSGGSVAQDEQVAEAGVAAF